MPDYYIYLVSSLPMLHFGAKPPLSFDGFISLCSGKIAEGAIDTLKRSSINGDYAYDPDAPAAVRQWQGFDTALRNEIAKARSLRKKADPARYLHRDGAWLQSELFHLAMAAIRSRSSVESEKILDEARWRALDEFEKGHYFDLDILAVYAHKLLILEKWEEARTAKKDKLLESVMAGIKE